MKHIIYDYSQIIEPSTVASLALSSLILLKLAELTFYSE